MRSQPCSTRKKPTTLSDAACWPIGCLANALTAILSVFLARPLAVTAPDLAYLLLFGLVQMTLGLGLLVMGTRRLPAADAAIIGLVEAPLAPLWVWLALGDTPSGQTMIGGALVLAAAAGHIVAGRERPAGGSSKSGRRAISS